MQCSKCHRDAIVFQPYSGLQLCDQHLIADIEAKAKKMIRAHGRLEPGDHIAVLLSGSRIDNALLWFLKKLTAQRRDIRISAITTADETDRHGGISYAKRIATDLDTELLEMPRSEEPDISMENGPGKNPELSSLPSSPAPGSIRLDGFARQHGITKIAWGLCLDEAAGVVLGYMVRGDADQLVRNRSGQDALLRICPFISITAAEVSLYAELCGFCNEQLYSPCQKDGLHRDTITMLDGYTKNHPATKYALLNLGENLAGLPGITGLIGACERYGAYQRCCCNDLTSNEVSNGAR